eukprot:scaffold10334_cov71-Phaeocystis_antarctica.AAC.7
MSCSGVKPGRRVDTPSGPSGALGSIIVRVHSSSSQTCGVIRAKSPPDRAAFKTFKNRRK